MTNVEARTIIELLPVPSGEGVVYTFIRANLQTAVEQLGRAVVISHKDSTDRLEIYDILRYFTWTGRPVRAVPIGLRQDELATLYQEWFPEKTDKHEEMQPGQHLDLSDQDLLAHASRAKDSNGERFRRLWSGNRSDYRDPHTNTADENRADFALLAMLAYWNGRDPIKNGDAF